MGEATYQMDVPVSVATLFEFHRDLRMLPRIHPPEMRLEVVNPDIALEIGAVVKLKLRMPPLPNRVQWDAVLVELVENEYWVDVQVLGPFKRWRHEHRFIALDEHNSRLIDHVEYDVFGGLMEVVGEKLVRTRLDWMFEYRHASTRAILLDQKSQSELW